MSYKKPCALKKLQAAKRSWAKVISSQASVCPQGGGGWWSGPGGSRIFRGGGVSNFSEGLQFFGGVSNFFFWDAPPYNEWPVRYLLECILVLLDCLVELCKNIVDFFVEFTEFIERSKLEKLDFYNPFYFSY